MHSAPHRNNSDFQLRHFIAGRCHTPDAAWAILYEQKLDIEQKLASTRARKLRREAKRLDIQHCLEYAGASQADKLRARADLMEWEAAEGLIELAIAGAEREIATIEGLMAELEPHRKFKHLPLLEATEAAQHDEWLGEFKERIENYLLSQGTIPEDQIAAMRAHPAFEKEIRPYMIEKAASLVLAENKFERLAAPEGDHGDA